MDKNLSFVKLVNTFSIVAYDPQKQEWGVAVQSKFLAAAAVVSWAQANAGAVATQSYANAAFTGKKCQAWAGHIVGDGYTCQGNILLPGTVEAMAVKFEEVRQEAGELADWLVLTLEAGQEAGGDKRGRQAAGVLVVRDEGGYGGNNDRYLDLRVDDHPYPILKLKQLVENHHLLFGEVNPGDLIPLESVAQELQGIMRKTGHYQGEVTGSFNERTRAALRNLVGEENLEERWNGKGKVIDNKVIEYLREKFT